MADVYHTYMSSVCMHLFCGLILPLEDQWRPSKGQFWGYFFTFWPSTHRTDHPMADEITQKIFLCVRSLLLWPLPSTRRPVAAF